MPDFARHAETDPAARTYREFGFKRILSIPVKQRDRVIAFVTMHSRDETAYNAEQLALCERLPLAEAVLMALRYDETKRLEDSINLMRDLGKVSNGLERTARVLVERLARDFEEVY